MALWVILGIRDQGGSQDPKDPWVTKEDKDSASLDREDPLGKKAIKADRVQEVAEGSVELKERLDPKEFQETQVNQVNQVIQEREGQEGSQALMEIRDPWGILD